MLPSPPRITIANALTAARSPICGNIDIDRAEQRAGRGGKARTDGKGRVCRSGSTLTPISDGGVRILKGRAHRACRAWCG